MVKKKERNCAELGGLLTNDVIEIVIGFVYDTHTRMQSVGSLHRISYASMPIHINT